MRCERFDAADLFFERVGPFLEDREAENTIPTSVAMRCRRRPQTDALMLAVGDRSGVRLAAVMTPPFNLVLSAGDAAAVPALVEALRGAGIAPPGVSGPRDLADAFAGLWRARQGATLVPEHDLVLHQASGIVDPTGVPGELRPATEGDVDLLAEWDARFIQDTGLSPREVAGGRDLIAARIAHDQVFVWTVDGRPVSTVAFVPSTPREDAGRINRVFTPASERNRGYAQAATAALSRQLLSRGWRYCLVFADADNPVTMRIYPRIGYVPLGRYRSIGLA